MACYSRGLKDGGVITTCVGMLTIQSPERHKKEWERIFLGIPSK